MLRTWRRVLLASAILAGVAVATVFYVYARSGDAHYSPGNADVSGYALTARPMELKVYFTTGWQDLVGQPVVLEDDRAVTITIPTQVSVPCRGCFKQLSATLLDATVTLRAPLGQRVVRSGATNTQVQAVPSR
jgi:hypothetical protein